MPSLTRKKCVFGGSETPKMLHLSDTTFNNVNMNKEGFPCYLGVGFGGGGDRRHAELPREEKISWSAINFG